MNPCYYCNGYCTVTEYNINVEFLYNIYEFRYSKVVKNQALQLVFTLCFVFNAFPYIAAILAAADCCLASCLPLNWNGQRSTTLPLNPFMFVPGFPSKFFGNVLKSQRNKPRALL